MVSCMARLIPHCYFGSLVVMWLPKLPCGFNRWMTLVKVYYTIYPIQCDWLRDISWFAILFVFQGSIHSGSFNIPRFFHIDCFLILVHSRTGFSSPVINTTYCFHSFPLVGASGSHVPLDLPHPGCMYLITELCAGGSLAERLEAQRRHGKMAKGL